MPSIDPSEFNPLVDLLKAISSIADSLKNNSYGLIGLLIIFTILFVYIAPKLKDKTIKNIFIFALLMVFALSAFCIGSREGKRQSLKMENEVIKKKNEYLRENPDELCKNKNQALTYPTMTDSTQFSDAANWINEKCKPKSMQDIHAIYLQENRRYGDYRVSLSCTPSDSNNSIKVEYEKPKIFEHNDPTLSSELEILNQDRENIVVLLKYQGGRDGISFLKKK